MEEDPTSVHARRAAAGDAASVEWIVGRFTPFLLTQARYRLGERLRAFCAPEDLVDDVWLGVLRNFSVAMPEDGRRGPAWVKYLSEALLRRVRDLYEKHILGKPDARAIDASGRSSGGGPPDPRSGVVTSVVRREMRSRVLACIEELDPLDREVVVLRGIEQNPYAAIAAILSLPENTIAVRYGRALARLRPLLPESLAEEFAPS